MIDHETDAPDDYAVYPGFTTDVAVPPYARVRRRPWWHDGFAWAASMLAANATALAWAVMLGWITPWAWLMVVPFVLAALGALVARVAWEEYGEGEDAR